MNEKLIEKNGIKAKMQIARLKKELAEYDYIGVKIATGVATVDEYANQIAYCEDLRRQIRELEGK